jgi:hypothetical protein
VARGCRGHLVRRATSKVSTAPRLSYTPSAARDPGWLMQPPALPASQPLPCPLPCRLALARALYSPSSLLLLDDVLSALDAPCAQHITQALLHGREPPPSSLDSARGAAHPAQGAGNQVLSCSGG